MDHRTPLKRNTALSFDSMTCYVEEVIGRGSNAIVYHGWYADRLSPDQRHLVLIKELFPFHPKKKIRRADDNTIIVEPEAEQMWQTHRESFIVGNEIHLRLLSEHPDILGANLNSFPCNGTLYSVLGYSGGRSLQAELAQSRHDLRSHACRMLKLLNALDAFHKSGYLHLDISPDNIMLVGQKEQERVFLIDYNSARPLHTARICYSSCKVGYSAPELETDQAEQIGFPTDLYSVAAVFFHCLMGRALTLEEMLQPKAPDAKDSPCLTDMPETVRAMVSRILRKALHTLPEKRYGSIDQMRDAFCELIDRIDCVGVTHWALWETGKRSVRDMIRVNPALQFLDHPDQLYPIRLQQDSSMLLPQYLDQLLYHSCDSGLIVGQGGMGKTTLLLQTALLQTRRYSATSPAVFYISLRGWSQDDPNYIYDQILTNLRFKQQMNTYDNAMHALRQLLRRRLPNSAGELPTVLLLLDGLNEISGDPAPLIHQIRELSALEGVQILAASRGEIPELTEHPAKLVPLTEEDVDAILSSRGLLIPQQPDMLRLLQTPLILSLYLQAGSAGMQPNAKTEEELLQAYLQALYRKELDQLPDHSPRRWQLEVALHYILPCIAARSLHTGGTMTQLQLLRLLRSCRKTLRSALGRKLFPQWIGRSREIFGDTTTAEEWYGLMVHQILWQQLGLLIKEPDGSYRIFHQIVCEHLAKGGRSLMKKQRGTQLLAGSILTGLCAAALITALAVLLPKNYNTQQTELVMDHVIACYGTYADQLEHMHSITQQLQDGAVAQFSQSCPDRAASLQEDAAVTTYEDNCLAQIDALCASGDRVAWSKLPFDGEIAKAIVSQSSALAEEYLPYLQTMERWAASENAQRLCPDLPQTMLQLLQTDGKIMAKYYYLCCMPHLEQAHEPWKTNTLTALSWFPYAEKEPEESLQSLLRIRQQLVTQLAGQVTLTDNLCATGA